MKKVKPKDEAEAMRLLFEMPAEDAADRSAESMHRRYDASRLERDQPKLVNLITALLAVPGMKYESIAKAAGVAWESVAAIAAARKTPIREIRLKTAGQLMLVIEAAVPGLLERAAKGEINELGVKLLVDALQQLSGDGHVVRFEGSQEDDPRRARLRQLISSPPMVLEAEVISQEGAALPAAAARCLAERVQLNSEEPIQDSQSVIP